MRCALGMSPELNRAMKARWSEVRGWGFCTCSRGVVTAPPPPPRRLPVAPANTPKGLCSSLTPPPRRAYADTQDPNRADGHVERVVLLAHARDGPTPVHTLPAPLRAGEHVEGVVSTSIMVLRPPHPTMLALAPSMPGLARVRSIGAFCLPPR